MNPWQALGFAFIAFIISFGSTQLGPWLAFRVFSRNPSEVSLPDEYEPEIRYTEQGTGGKQKEIVLKRNEIVSAVKKEFQAMRDYPVRLAVDSAIQQYAATLTVAFLCFMELCLLRAFKDVPVHDGWIDFFSFIFFVLILVAAFYPLIRRKDALELSYYLRRQEDPVARKRTVPPRTPLVILRTVLMIIHFGLLYLLTYLPIK